MDYNKEGGEHCSTTGAKVKEETRSKDVVKGIRSQCPKDVELRLGSLSYTLDGWKTRYQVA